MTLFVTAGHKLMERNNQHMMTIVYDGNKTGTHELQKGMCSGYRFRLAQQENRLAEYYPPDHGDSGSWLLRKFVQAVDSYGIIPEDIPSPFNLNLNQHMTIDGVTGKMEPTQFRPPKGNYMDIRAEMDLLVALSACPDLAVGGKPVNVVIYQR